MPEVKPLAFNRNSRFCYCGTSCFDARQHCYHLTVMLFPYMLDIMVRRNNEAESLQDFADQCR